MTERPVSPPDAPAETRSEGADPLYRQISRRISEQVSLGSLQRGDRLPSERSLCEQFGVSRVTLRRALQQLVKEGVVAASRGSGWYVTTHVLGEPPNALLSFTEMAQSKGLAASARVLEADVRSATLDQADALSVAPGAELFHLKRLRLLDEIPIAFDQSEIPLSFAPDLVNYDFSAVSLYGTLENRLGIIPTRADYAVEAVAADEYAAGLLELTPGAPTLVTHQTTYEQNDRPFELSTMTYRGDRYRFRAALLRHPTDWRFDRVR